MNPGYIGSFLVHGALIALGLSAASLAVFDSREEPAAPPLPVVELTPSGGDSGNPGGNAAPEPKRPVAFAPVQVIDADKILKDWRANRVAAAPAPAPAPTSPKPERPVSGPSSHPIAPAPRPVPPAPAPGGISSGPLKPLVAPTVDAGASGAGPAGPTNAPGAPGTPGPGSGNSAGFTSSVRAVFAETFVPLFRERGTGISSDKDSGEVKLLVSPAGNVAFAGWSVRPSEPLLEEIVLRAIATMRPVPPPPGGAETIVRLRFSGTVE